MARNITITFEDGSSHIYQNAPDDATPEQATQRAEAEFGRKVVHLDGGAAGAPPEQPKGRIESAYDLLSGLTGRLSSAREERVKQVGEVLDETNNNFVGEKQLQLLGKGVAGPILDVAGEVVSTGVGVLSDLVDPAIRKGFNDIMQGIADSPFAKNAIEAYKELDPTTQRTVDSVFNIANVMAPFKLKAKQGSGLHSTLVEGTTVVPKREALKRDMLRGLFQAERSADNIAEELTKGTARFDKVLDDLMEVKGVSPVYTPERNIAAIRNKQASLEANIKGQLATFDKTGTWVKDIKTSFNNLVEDTIKNEPSMRELGLTAKKQAEIQASIMRKFGGVVKNMEAEGINRNSLRGLLEARRKLDKALNSSAFSKMSSDQIGELSLEKHVIMQMRGKLNDTISGLVEQMGKGDAKITSLLKKQSSLYIAEDNYVTKTAKSLSDLSEKGAITKALSAHPILVYRALQSSGTSPAFAAILAAPSAINMGTNMGGSVRRALTPPPSFPAPPVRAGLFYGEPEEQQQ